MLRVLFGLMLVLCGTFIVPGCTAKDPQPDPSTVPDIPPGRSKGAGPASQGAGGVDTKQKTAPK